MKIVIAPDKFKGSLTSIQVCHCIRRGILKTISDCEVKIFPMADGGDGFASVMKYYLHTETINIATVDPLFRSINASYEWDGKNKTAIVELASASGLALLKRNEQNPLYTSTYGTGLLIKHAIYKGARKIILGLGGSATNDAGTGILSSLGFEFKDKSNNVLKPVGENLQHMHYINVPSSLSSIEFIVATDVTNTLFGNDGAAYIYAAQKGADENAIQILDNGLQHFALVLQLQTGHSVAYFKGSGAAGGVAAGLSAFYKTEIVSGAGLIQTTSNIENDLKNTDLLITGEGRLDRQSNSGKVIHQIAETGKRYNIPVVAFCGEVDSTEEQIKNLGLQAVASLVNKNLSKEAAMKKAAALLELTAASYFIK